MEVFSKYKVSGLEKAYGLGLAAAVTALLGVQAFLGEKDGGPVKTDAERDLCVGIFAVHLITLPFVAYDYFVANGVKGTAASFTIGCGAAATLGQTAAVAVLGGLERSPIPIVTLLLQCLAVSLMLAFIVADIRLHLGYTTREQDASGGMYMLMRKN